MAIRKFESRNRSVRNSREQLRQDDGAAEMERQAIQRLQKAAVKAASNTEESLSANAFQKNVFGSKTRRQMGEQHSRLQRYEALMQRIKLEGESKDGKSVPFAVVSSHNKITGTFVGILSSFSTQEFEPVRRAIQVGEDSNKWKGTLVVAALKMKSVGPFGDFSLEHMDSSTHLPCFETSIEPEEAGNVHVESLGLPAVFIGTTALSHHKNDALQPVSSQVDWMLRYSHFGGPAWQNQPSRELAHA